MDPLIQEGTPKTPFVNFDADRGLIELAGRSIPEDSINYYKPLLDWIGEYGKEPQEATTVNLKLEYFNTSSSKCILDVFKKLEVISRSGMSKVTVNWYFEEEDEDMQEAGQDYESITAVPFNIVEVEEL